MTARHRRASEKRKQRRAIHRLADYLNGCIGLWAYPPFDPNTLRFKKVSDFVFGDHVVKLAVRIQKANQAMLDAEREIDNENGARR